MKIAGALVLVLMLLGCASISSSAPSRRTVLFSARPQEESWQKGEWLFKGLSIWYSSKSSTVTKFGYLKSKGLYKEDGSLKFFGFRFMKEF